MKIYLVLLAIPIALANVPSSTAEMTNFSCIIPDPDDATYRLATSCQILREEKPSYEPCPILKEKCLTTPCLHLVQLARFPKTCFKLHPQDPPCIQHTLSCTQPPIRISPQTYLPPYLSAIYCVASACACALIAYTAYTNYHLRKRLPNNRRHVQVDDAQDGCFFRLTTMCATTQGNLSGLAFIDEDADMLQGENTSTSPSIMAEN